MKEQLMEEAALLQTLHPSKDARAFAKNVYEYLAEIPHQTECVPVVSNDLLSCRACIEVKKYAESLIHADRSCSLEAQGFDEISCAEIGTADNIGFKLLEILAAR